MTVFEKIMKQLHNHKHNTEVLLLRNEYNDFAAYKFMAGKLRGIEEVHSIIKETLKGMSNEQE